MVIGHPDWGSWAGRNVGGGEINSVNFSGSIASEATGTITFATVPTGEEWIYQNIMISSDDDTAIHYCDLYRNSDNKIFYTKSLILSDNADFPGQKVVAGDHVKLEITNNSAAAAEFIGSVFWIVRKI